MSRERRPGSRRRPPPACVRANAVSGFPPTSPRYHRVWEWECRLPRSESQERVWPVRARRRGQGALGPVREEGDSSDTPSDWIASLICLFDDLQARIGTRLWTLHVTMRTTMTTYGQSRHILQNETKSRNSVGNRQVCRPSFESASFSIHSWPARTVRAATVGRP